MEHQPSGLIWNLDNWIYITYQNVRYRYTNGEFKTEIVDQTTPRDPAAVDRAMELVDG